MKKFVIHFLLLLKLIVTFSNAQNNGGCVLNGVTDGNWNSFFTNIAVDDTERDVFRRFEAENINNFTFSGTSAKYIRANLENDGFFLIAPSQEFENFEINENSSPNSPSLSVTFTFTCIAGTSELIFVQPITDINNHAPEFSTTSYTYFLPMPFPTGITISGIFGDSITATDVDVTNVVLDFSIYPEGDFTISYISSDSKFKTHTAALTAVRALRLSSTTTYVITATDRGTLPGPLSSNATLIIEVDEENSVISSPIFDSSYYTASYSNVTDGMDFIILNSIITLTDNNYENTTFGVQGDYSNYFTISSGTNQVNFALNSNLPIDVIEETYLVVSVMATRNNSEYEGKTVVIVNLPEKAISVVPSPIFSSPYYTGSYNVIEEGADNITLTSEITLTDGDYGNTNFTVEGDYSTYFSLNKLNTKVEVILSGELSDELLFNVDFILVPIKASRNDAEVDSYTVIAITLPGEECTSTTTSVAESTTESSIAVSINFEKNHYLISLESMHVIGVIGSVSAYSSIDEDIIYSLSPTDDSSIPSELYINSSNGNLVTTDYISSGSYLLLITATGSRSGSNGTSVLNLYVSSIEICSDEDVKTTYSIITKHITEEKLNYDILTFEESVSLKNYTYVIIEQFPSTNPFFFEINSTTGSLQNSRIIDREWNGISDMYVSQFTLRIRLVKIGEPYNVIVKENSNDFYPYDSSSTFARKVYDEEDRSWVNIEEKLYNLPKETTVSVIVDDVNDHSPVFTAGSLIVVGYPGIELVQKITPSSLLTLEATDEDIGDNAAIKYSTNSDYFLVHESTGIVYVGSSIFRNKDEEIFTVTATDRDGKSDGLSTSIQIQVKKLREKDITVLSISGATLEDVNDILQSVSSAVGYQVKAISSSVVPSSSATTNNKRRIARAASNYTLQLITYAYDSNYELIETDDLQEAIADADTLNGYSAVSWTTQYNSRNSATSSSTSVTGYLVSVIVLGVLLVLLMAAAVTFYFVYFKRLAGDYDKMKEESTPPSYENDQKISENVNSTKSNLVHYNKPIINSASPNLYEDVEDVSKSSENKYLSITERRPTKYAFSSPGIDLNDNQENLNNETSTDDAPNFLGENEKVNNVSTQPKRERRKSVTFNTTVEHIEIEKDDSDEDEVENERL